MPLRRWSVQGLAHGAYPPQAKRSIVEPARGGKPGRVFHSQPSPGDVVLMSSNVRGAVAPLPVVGAGALRHYILRGVAQPGSALEWGSSGPRFESGRPDCQHTKART